jgi:ribokinase
MPRPIVVIGSANMDLVCKTPHMPSPGQTILGCGFATIPGGKGANQAVAAAKLGGQVHFVGRIGDDDFGQRLLVGLQQHKVSTRHVTITEGMPSGVAVILVDTKGENSIIVARGANQHLTPADVDHAAEVLRQAAVCVMQLEIPLETAEHAAALCRQFGVRCILDPAPAPAKLPRGLWAVDVFTPNQSEAETLLGETALGRLRRPRRPDAKQIVSELLRRGPRSVVLKLSEKGALMMDRGGEIQQVRGHRVRVVDTTAAGDAFTAALAVGLAEEMPLPAAVRFANAAGAVCCQTFGAQPAVPTRQAVEALLRAES